MKWLLLFLLAATDVQARPIEICFSPTEPCAPKLIELINSAQHSLSVAIYSLTNAQLTDAVIAVYRRGVVVKVVADRGQASSSARRLIAAGVPFKYGNQEGIMHHKYVLVDGHTLETGSYNYSYAAEQRNKENQVYIYDTAVINAFAREFDQMWAEGILP